MYINYPIEKREICFVLSYILPEFERILTDFSPSELVTHYVSHLVEVFMLMRLSAK